MVGGWRVEEVNVAQRKAQRKTDAETPRTPGQRAGLTHEAVLAAGQTLLSEHGLDGLTMRGLASRLGVAPNALYSHVASKTALIDDLLDAVLALVESPDEGALAASLEEGGVEPVEGLELVMVSTYRVLLAHPDLVPLYLARQGARGENAERLGEVMLTLLARAGVTGELALEARRVLIVYTMGFAALATPQPVEPGVVGPVPGEEIAGNFTRGLRWLLAGVLADRVEG